MSLSNIRKFRSLRDWWVGILVFAVPGLSAFAMWELFNETGQIPIAMMLISGAAIILVLWIYFGTYYVIEDRELRIFHGPFRWKISLASIQGVEETRSPLSSPALSMNRLKITYKVNKQVMVSPERRAEFVSLLKMDSQ